MAVGRGGTYTSCLPLPSSSPSTTGHCPGTAAPPWPPRAGGTPGMLLSTIKAAEMPHSGDTSWSKELWAWCLSTRLVPNSSLIPQELLLAPCRNPLCGEQGAAGDGGCPDTTPAVPPPSHLSLSSAAFSASSSFCRAVARRSWARSSSSSTSWMRRFREATSASAWGAQKHGVTARPQCIFQQENVHLPGAPLCAVLAQLGHASRLPTPSTSLGATQPQRWKGCAPWGSTGFGVCRAVSKGGGMPRADSLPKRRWEPLVDFLFTEAAAEPSGRDALPSPTPPSPTAPWGHLGPPCCPPY